jgi:hypothetical protein
MDTLYATDQTFNELNYASSNVVYISLPDNNTNCSNWLSQLPSLPSGWSYRCSANPTNIDGSGWIPIPFNSFPILNISQLPIDPRNQPPYYYSFVVGGSYAVYGQLEDPKHQASKNDGDNYPHLFSAGNNKRLIDQAQGLVGYWPFDEGSGTIAKDYSGNGNNGTLVNGPTWTTGKVGGALSFDGVDDYVRVPYNPNLNVLNNKFTIAMWLNMNTQTGTERYILGKFNYLNSGYYIFMYSGENKVSFGFHGGGIVWILKTSDITYNQWQHIAVTLDGNIMKVYLNGILISSTNGVGAIGTDTNNLTIGGITPSLRVGNKFIDDARIYNRALSDAEIQALYNATK